MKKFIFKFALFIIPLIPVSFCFDLLLSHYLKKSNSFAQKEYSTWNAIVDGKLNSEILIYGSSRAWVQFDPSILQDSLGCNVYNLGIDGHPFVMQLLRHELTLKYNPKPKTIIQSIYARTLRLENLYNHEQFLPYMLWDDTFYRRMSILEGFSYFDYKIPLIRYYGEFESIKTAAKMALNQSNPTERIRGYKPNDLKWNKDFDKAKKIMNEYVIEPSELVIELFDQYLKECKENNIEVILVYSPYYIEGQKFIKNLPEVIDMYKAFAKKYNLVFLDFTEDEICYDKKYFYNASHMNKQGAELFTRKLAHRLKTALVNCN